MSDSSSQANRENDSEGTQPFLYALKIGFFAGLIWGAIRWLAVSMNLTKVPAAFLVDPWVKRSALYSPYWQVAGYALFILMSMAAALIYISLMRRLRGPVPGIVFGLLWWAVFYLNMGPAIGAVPPIRKMGWNSLITDMCLFLAWGLFIGYSIAFEFNNEAKREPETAGA